MFVLPLPVMPRTF